MSPSFKTRLPGTPCTTCSLTEIQVQAGYGGCPSGAYPKNGEPAPYCERTFTATISRSLVVVLPGTIVPAVVTNIVHFGRERCQMISRPTVPAPPPAGQSGDQRLIVNREIQNRQQTPALTCQQFA